ncbi:hypothetical protein [Bacillus pumilus]|uniref:hypothetical protein n=1 Tax=Bacillus pumilus TaxID=1408 RepID=UPI00349E64D2
MTKSEFEKGMRYVKAAHAIEGIYLTADEEELICQHASRQITDEEFERKALELAYSDIIDFQYPVPSQFGEGAKRKTTTVVEWQLKAEHREPNENPPMLTGG